jgi:hypothetical protein
MNDQATNVNPTDERQSDVLNEESWSAEDLPYVEDSTPRGFLQLCADRRFHSLIQNVFQKDAGLQEPTDYWIHADAGGTPKMAELTIAPNYCYNDKGVRLMGWSAHGAGCGGFGEDVKDKVIWEALWDTLAIQLGRYPDARHFCYFVTIKGNKTIVYSLKTGKGSKT